MSLPILRLFALGGTIATMPGDAGGMKMGLGADDLVAMVPALGAVATVRAETVSKLGSSDLTIDAILALAARIEALAGAPDRPAGVVITQGTDTLEETSFLMDAVLDLDLPVVFTAAMRNPRLTSPDGAGNLLAAARVATSAWLRDHARATGVVAVLLDHAHAPFDIVKSETSRVDAFRSPVTGPLATIVEDRVVPLAMPVRTWKASVVAALGASAATALAATPAAPVALLWGGLDDNGALIDAILAAPDRLGYRGAVFAAFGGGHLPQSLVATLHALHAAMPVVLAPRTGGGPLLRSTYEGAAFETGLRAAGLVFSGRLHPLKARLLLSLLLRAGKDRATIARVLDGCG